MYNRFQMGGKPQVQMQQEQAPQQQMMTPEQENQIITAFLQTIPDKTKQKQIIEQLMKLKKENPQAYQQALMQMAQSLQQQQAPQQQEPQEEEMQPMMKMGGYNNMLKRKLKKGGKKC